MTAWLIAHIEPYVLGLMALFAAYLRGKHSGKVDAHRNTLESYAKTRKDIDDADLGAGATDFDRIDRLRKFAGKR